MAKEKYSFEQFFKTLDAEQQAFAQDLHKYLTDNGYKVEFEEKKDGLSGSYKLKRRVVGAMALRKQGLVIRINSENISSYSDFLGTLPKDMIQIIEDKPDCKNLVSQNCSWKDCSGFDFKIGKKHYQKCHFMGFEFLVTKKNKSYIKSFVKKETEARAVA